MLLEWGSEISDSRVFIEKKIEMITFFALFHNFLVDILQVVWNNGLIDKSYDYLCLAQWIANKKNKLSFFKVFCLFRNLWLTLKVLDCGPKICRGWEKGIGL